MIVFSESLRQEARFSNIRVTTIEPGGVTTELEDNLTDPEGRKQYQQWLHSFTPLTSEDIANAIIYAVSQPEHVDVNEILIRPTLQAQ